jgi:hypothetical protein
MKKNVVLFFLLMGCPAWSSQVYNFFFLSGTNPGFFTFDVNGVSQRLLCDEIFPNVTTLPYQAIGYSLSELASAPTLALFGDPNELLKYEKVAILDLQAYLDPTLAGDVVRANRIIVDGSGPHTPGADTLLAFVDTQDPANYPQLGKFLIFSNSTTQEITGFLADAPEPGNLGLVAAVFLAIVFQRRLARSRPAVSHR